jgi:hypothetical protein
MYESGNGAQRVAVETQYISSVVLLRQGCTKSEWNLVMTMMPRSIYKAYSKQLASEKVSNPDFE